MAAAIIRHLCYFPEYSDDLFVSLMSGIRDHRIHSDGSHSGLENIVENGFAETKRLKETFSFKWFYISP